MRYPCAVAPVAIVTGAARRVGRATAVELAARGFDLLLTRHRSAGELERTAEEVRRAGHARGHATRVETAELDLGDPRAVERFARAVRAPVDVLVHNASRYEAGPIGSIRAEDAMADYTVNALAPLLLTQGMADALRASSLEGGGLVVALGDIHAAGRPIAGYPSYLMSKAALHAMVETLAVALAPKVRVNGILPGVLAWPQGADPAMVKRYEARIPLARAGTPEDAGRLIASMAMDMPYVTGTLMRLDGGRWLM